MTTSLASLLELLDLEQIEQGRYRGNSPKTSMQRVFGGQVAAQALVAAGRTVDTHRYVHSLHAYFLRGGDPAAPILYSVDWLREGRSFSTRLVTAQQYGRTIFTMSASFHVAEDGLSHQVAAPPAPEPESLPSLAERVDAEPGYWPEFYREWGSFDIRHVEHPTGSRQITNNGQPAHAQFWLRAADFLPHETLLHTAVLSYASDLTLLSTSLIPHGISPSHPEHELASLDHAVWFHRRIRADQWLLYDQESPSLANARGLTTGRLFTRDGMLAASVHQEGLVRRIR